MLPILNTLVCVGATLFAEGGGVPAPARQEPLEEYTFAVEKAPELERWFDAGDRWGGADGVFSIPLDPNRLLVTFGDTFTDRQRHKMVNNSIAILRLEGSKPVGIEFYFGRTPQGEIRSFVVPEGKPGLFWLGPGLRDGGRLHLFAAHIELLPAGGPFGFRQIGEALLTVENPDDPPPQWQIRQQMLPFFRTDERGSTVFGAAVLVAPRREARFVYVYGVDEEKTPLFPLKHAVVARAPKGNTERLEKWEFYCGPATPPPGADPAMLTESAEYWGKDYRRATRLAAEVASEYSVSFLPALNRYVMVYTRLGLSQEIMMRTAPTPAGPWSQAVTLYRVPSLAEDQKAFFYAAKAHPALAADDELVISYVANSFDFAKLVRTPEIYRPWFIRVKLIRSKS